jgi:hypothetical protein
VEGIIMNVLESGGETKISTDIYKDLKGPDFPTKEKAMVSIKCHRQV